MPEGSSVQEHVLNKYGYIYQLEAMGSDLDADTQIEAIFNSLPKSFDSVVNFFTMKKLQWTLSELMFQLQAAEERMKIGKGSSVCPGGRAFGQAERQVQEEQIQESQTWS